MACRWPLLTTLIGLTCWLGSCQQTPQISAGTAPPSTMTIASALLGDTARPFVIAGAATSIYTPMLGVTPTTLTFPASPNSSLLAITVMRARAYPGSDIVIESTLSAGLDYNRYIVSYQSDGLKLFGLLTIPTGVKPAGGRPVIL